MRSTANREKGTNLRRSTGRTLLILSDSRTRVRVTGTYHRNRVLRVRRERRRGYDVDGETWSKCVVSVCPLAGKRCTYIPRFLARSSHSRQEGAREAEVWSLEAAGMLGRKQSRYEPRCTEDWAEADEGDDFRNFGDALICDEP
jgi:hypothetical protein